MHCACVLLHHWMRSSNVLLSRGVISVENETRWKACRLMMTMKFHDYFPTKGPADIVVSSSADRRSHLCLECRREVLERRTTEARASSGRLQRSFSFIAAADDRSWLLNVLTNRQGRSARLPVVWSCFVCVPVTFRCLSTKVAVCAHGRSTVKLISFR